MKTQRFILLLLSVTSIVSFSQEIATLKNGKKVILYPNKTWEYQPEKLLDTSLTNKTGLYISSDILKTYGIFKYPNLYSLKINNFPIEPNIHVLEVINKMLMVKSKTGRVAYIYSTDHTFAGYRDEIDNITIANAKNVGQNILIKGVYVNNINSAKGVDIIVEWGYFNSSKNIKYIYLTFVPYNNVGDVVYSEIGNSSSFTGKITGPISSEDVFQESIWENAWYNSTITCIKLTKVSVEYTNGTSDIYLNDLTKILDNNFTNKCN